ncbi:MAG: FixH family protein [Polyangiaceae bacterium]|nr:FixH family protein [Polyangiaceae bacterium]
MKHGYVLVFALAALMCGVLPACSSDSSDDTPKETQDSGREFVCPTDALMCAWGDNRLLNVVIRTTPQPPVQGQNSMELTVTDNDGNPVDGLTIKINPNMPSMGHGSPLTTPTFDAQGNGKYLDTNVVFQMGGQWQLDITLTGSVSDHVASMVQVP